MDKNILLIGEGQIGNAIKSIEEDAKNNVFVIELNKPLPAKVRYDVCHVCMPYSNDFSIIVGEYISIYKPEITIIHSTVKPNTTKELISSTSREIVYSPCMGTHPDLYKSLLTFTKLVGGDKDFKASRHLRDIGITTYDIDDPTETEMGKLLSTTYYLFNIYYAKLVKDICNKNDLEFENVYTMFNKVYNDGYEKLNMPNVIRPILFPPSKEGIGGHCLTDNARLLYECGAKELTEPILSMGYITSKKYKDKTWLFCEYVIKDRSMEDIAEECKAELTNVIEEINKLHGCEKNYKEQTTKKANRSRTNNT